MGAAPVPRRRLLGSIQCAISAFLSRPFVPNLFVLLAKAVSHRQRGSRLTKREAVLLVVHKIRTGVPHDMVAAMFGVDAGAVSRIFARIVPVTTDCLGGLVRWPKPVNIRSQLPHAFKAFTSTFKASSTALRLKQQSLQLRLLKACRGRNRQPRRVPPGVSWQVRRCCRDGNGPGPTQASPPRSATSGYQRTKRGTQDTMIAPQQRTMVYNPSTK